MDAVIPISEVRSNLPKLVDLADSLFQKTYITVKGKIKAILVNPNELELMEETLEVLHDNKTMKAIKLGQAEVKKNRLIDWKELKAELEL